MSNVVTFPIKGTPLANWYNKAKHIAGRDGLVPAVQYIDQHVPEQFAAIIERNVRLRYENSGTTGHAS